MFMHVFKCEIFFQVSSRNLASGLPNTKTQHLFSSIYPRPSVQRRETPSLLQSISSCTGGSLSDKFNSYLSPLARHQAHVVPEQMHLRCILFRFQCCVQFPIPASITRVSHYRLSLLPLDFRLADYPIILPQNLKLSKILIYPRAQRSQ